MTLDPYLDVYLQRPACQPLEVEWSQDNHFFPSMEHGVVPSRPYLLLHSAKRKCSTMATKGQAGGTRIWARMLQHVASHHTALELLIVRNQ